jgi:hypothetical protein
MRPDLTDITLVIDRSGSMDAIASDTIGAVNRFLDDQKSVSGDCWLTLVLFDHEYTPVHRAVPIRSVPELTSETYIPRGNTALLDAMGRAIVETGERLAAMSEANRPGKVIFAVITDGLENASQEYAPDKVFAMVREQQERYSWQIVYLGANQDAIRVGRAMGVSPANNLSYAASPAGMYSAVQAFSSNTRSLRSGEAVGMDFTDDQREEQRKHGAWPADRPAQ